MSIISVAKWVIRTRVELPNFCCATCGRLLAAWAKGSRCLPFAVCMVWREHKDRVSDCSFCLTSTNGVTANSKHTVQYPYLPSAMRPVPHSAELPCQSCRCQSYRAKVTGAKVTVPKLPCQSYRCQSYRAKVTVPKLPCQSYRCQSCRA